MIYYTNYMVSGTKAEDGRIQKELSKKLLGFAVKSETGRKLEAFDMNYGKHGKPYLKDSDIHFNITNCKGLICCAVESFEIGIDAETGRTLNPRIYRACTEREQGMIEASDNPDFTFLELWTLKESYMKYTGIGLAFGTKNAEFTYVDGQPVYMGSTDKPVYVRQAIKNFGGKTYIVSMCSGEACEMRFREVLEGEL